MHRKEKEESKKERGENERRVQGLIYKDWKDKRQARETRRQKWISDGAGASIFGGTVKKKIY